MGRGHLVITFVFKQSKKQLVCRVSIHRYREMRLREQISRAISLHWEIKLETIFVWPAWNSIPRLSFIGFFFPMSSSGLLKTVDDVTFVNLSFSRSNSTNRDGLHYINMRHLFYKIYRHLYIFFWEYIRQVLNSIWDLYQRILPRRKNKYACIFCQ